MVEGSSPDGVRLFWSFVLNMNSALRLRGYVSALLVKHCAHAVTCCDSCFAAQLKWMHRWRILPLIANTQALEPFHLYDFSGFCAENTRY